MRQDVLRAEWGQRISAYRTSKLGLIEWRGENNVNVHTIRKWISKLNNSVELAPAKRTPVSWIPVEVDAVVSRSVTTLLVVKVGRATIDIHPGFDSSLLSDVVKALMTVC